MITYFRMGDIEAQAGWRFARGSWGVKDAQGQIVAVFTSEGEASHFATSTAKDTEDTVERGA